MSLLLAFLIIMQPLTWFQFGWTKFKGINEPRKKIIRWIYDLSLKIIKNPKIRTGAYILISVGLAGTSMINVVACTEVKVEPKSQSILSNCVSSWVIIYFCYSIWFSKLHNSTKIVLWFLLLLPFLYYFFFCYPNT